LQSANGAPFTGDAVVTLEPADSAQGLKPRVSEFNHGAFSFEAVPVGKWKVGVEESGLRMPVLSTAVGGRAQAGNGFAVQDRPVTLVVRVSADGIKVEGFAKKNSKGAAGVMVVLIPTDPGAFPGLVRRDQSDSDGSFSVRNAAPGKYVVVAIDNGWDLDWSRPDGLERYLPGGVAVTVKDTADKVVSLSTAVPVQMR
jgi:hypothetical protein